MQSNCQIFHHAVNTHNVNIAEEILTHYDLKRHLITDHIKMYGDTSLRSIISQFKSRGLTKTVQRIID